MPRTTFRAVVEAKKPLVVPGAHDGLSARLIERAGFECYFIGGFPSVGARYGVPDIGLKGLGEISACVRDIVAAADLPVLVDGDDGYGDVKNVVHTLHTYERMGVGAIMFEDQTWPKRCGHMAGKNVVAAEFMAAKIRAAAAERSDPDTFIVARTDARAVHGLDEALRRAERYIAAGADGIFVEAPETVEELETVGRAFDVPQLANPLPGGRTPVLAPAELGELGFHLLVYGISLIMHVARAMEQALADMRAGMPDPPGSVATFEHYKEIVGFDEWTRIEDEHAPS